MTLTERLRRDVRAAGLICPTCGQPTADRGIRGLADAIGIPHSVLWRFIQGKDATGRTLDKIDAWLASRGEVP